MKTLFICGWGAFLAIVLCACGSVPKKLDGRALAAKWTNLNSCSNELCVATNVARYAILSSDVYHGAQIHMPPAGHWEPLCCTNCTNQDQLTGFYAEAWRGSVPNGQPEIVIAFRGTEDWRDWVFGNLQMVPFCNQYQKALEFARCVRSNHVEHIVMTGHSLGGGLAEYAQRHVTNASAVVFDSSPFVGALRTPFHKCFTKDVRRVYERGEILMEARRGLSPAWYRVWSTNTNGVRASWLDFYRGNPIGQHSMSDLAMSLVKLGALFKNEETTSVLNATDRTNVETCPCPKDHWPPLYSDCGCATNKESSSSIARK